MHWPNLPRLNKDRTGGRLSERHIIVHYHIFKNAGSTVDTFLNYNFVGHCGSVEGQNPWDTLWPEDILTYARSNKHLRAISSHQARLPVPSGSGISFHPILFVRHPIDRVASVYHFERREPYNQHHLSIRMAHENDLAGYIRWGLSGGNHTVLRNFQTIHLAARERDMRTAIATDEDLQNALRHLSTLPVFGVVEEFDHSIEKIVRYLSPHFGALLPKYQVVNRSTARRGNLQDRLEDIERQLGPDLYCELIEKNSLDLKLYEHALKIATPKSD
jgi:hypothetical protein